MDEVDIDNVEDLNELESRLYAQIHHEITDEPNKQNDIYMECNDQVIGKSIPNVINPDESFKTTSEANRIVSKRYWISGDQRDYVQHSHRRFIRNPFKTQNISQDQKQHLNRNGTKSNSNFSRNEQTKEAHNSRKVQADMYIEKTLSGISTPDSEPKDVTSCVENTIGEIDKQKLLGDVSNLKINPIADWMQRKKNHPNKKVTGNRNNVNAKNFKNSSINIKQGLFARQQEKLRKAKRIEERRQKCKKAKIFEAEIINKVKPTDIIDLDSDSDSDNSDVIVIPMISPPIFTVDDSGDEVDKNRLAITMEHEENALDSADVQMSSTTTSFIKPQNLSSQASSVPDSGEKRIEISSRCTSPCSIQSSDDFIGQTDRNRLLTSASGIADDEDLLVLTSDINSLLEVPENSKPACGDRSLNSNLKQPHEENFEANDTLKLTLPITSNQELLSRDYRVDHGQYRALDVYESESDKMESVYSKGANKSTVIRQIDTSSDDVEDIGNCSHRTKRLRKRRASSSNKESDPNNGNFVSSSDNEEYDEDDNNVLRTMVPFIAKGVAVEYYKPRKGNRTLFSNPIADKRISAKTNDATDRMSDTKFIETLNNLVQCQNGKKQKQTRTQEKDEDEDEESEIENIPTARDIAEKVLAEHNARNKPKKSISDDVAIPTNILKELEKVFETIDQLDKKKIDCEKLDDGTVQISDSSDSDREKYFIYKSVPGEKAQVIEYNPESWKNKNSPSRTHDENGSPIYNILYIRGPRDPGGIGWNNEMRKFYNESWNGEQFTLGKIFQKMNPDKSLWRIYTEDRFSLKLNKRSNVKCTNCCEFGHIRSKCKRPRKPLICYMCGDSGHLEPRCPNTLCLRCGNKTQVFTKSCNACSYQNRLTCPICKIRGHSLDYCPDKWRRYHSTTEGNTYPNNNVYYNPRKYCCICGARGHISDNCRSAVRFSEYPSVTSSIKSHHKSYNDVIMKSPYNGIAINLMYKPFQEHTFNLLNYTTSAKYYGRFLNAVGMNYLLKRKLGNDSDATVEMDVSATKKNKRLSEKYVANPYLKAAAANKEKSTLTNNAPNQVQEITESGSTDQQIQENSVINIVENSDKEVEVINSSKENDLQLNIQLNTVNGSPNTENFCNKNFKSPKNVTSTSSATINAIKLQTDSAIIFDSDSNYSFSEHFDIASRSENEYVLTKNLTSAETLKDQTRGDNVLATPISRPREMEALPDFIPLVDSTEEENIQHCENESAVNGISRRFVVAASDDDEVEEDNSKNLNLLTELPCEAKIYLTQFHTKFLLSPNGNAFLKKISQLHKLKTRLDFTSVGHVLIIFGLPTNQNKFQMELLLKYRELEDEKNQRQLHSSLNVPKRTYVLIKFLRDSIIQLMNNLGNVNHLLKRLQFLEKQQTKTGYKLAEKVRRSLNMILVGQAGLQDGTMHLDKLLIILKKLLNDVNDDVAPAELRSEISDHYKVIFSAYRHDNYQKLVDTYNKLISKNRMPLLKIDPILLGQKVLDTSLSEQQKQKMEQPKTPVVKSVTDNRENVPNASNHKNTKVLKRKQNTDVSTTSPNKIKMSLTRTVTSTNASQTFTSSARDENNKTYFKTKSILSNRSSKAAANTSTPIKTNNFNTAVVNKTKQTTSATNATALTNKSPINNNNLKKQTQMIMPPPTYVSPEKRSTTNNTIQEVTDKWQRACDTLLTQITSEKSVSSNVGDKKCSSKLPSNFWSGESMRYLENCVRLASTKPQILEKLQRVQKKSQNGQLSYNDYLAVIKLHNALNGK